jgi:hypothetical protein
MDRNPLFPLLIILAGVLAMSFAMVGVVSTGFVRGIAIALTLVATACSGAAIAVSTKSNNEG